MNLITITTKYKKNAKGTGQIVATGGSKRLGGTKQRTVPYDHEHSAAWNHGAAAAVLGNAYGLVYPSLGVTHEHVDNGVHRFIFPH